MTEPMHVASESDVRLLVARITEDYWYTMYRLRAAETAEKNVRERESKRETPLTPTSFLRRYRRFVTARRVRRMYHDRAVMLAELIFGICSCNGGRVQTFEQVIQRLNDAATEPLDI